MSRRTEHGGHRVELAVVQQRGDLPGEDVAQHAAADRGGDPEQGRVQRAEPVAQRLLGADRAEQAEARRVEHDHGGHHPLPRADARRTRSTVAAIGTST